MNKVNCFLASLVVGVIFFLVGCTKWLDVRPTNRIAADELFSDVSGIRSALNGIYQQVSSQTLFGRNYTWGLYSAMGYDYRPDDVTSELRYVMDLSNRNHEHASVQQLGQAIWRTSYNCIANCNRLINEVEKIPANFFPLDSVEKNLILGEAIAIRALLHFELVRLFAPSPKSSPNSRLVPYVDVYPAVHTVVETTERVLSKVIRDLDRAQSLVAENDTLVNRTGFENGLQSLMGGQNQQVDELFFSFRMHRLNYVAIKALLARVYLYAGDLYNARETAKYVHETYGPFSVHKWFLFTSQANSSGVNRYTKMADDILFAGYDPNLIQKTEDYMGTSARFRLNQQIVVWLPQAERDYRLNLVSPDNLEPNDFVSDKWRFTSSTQPFRQAQNHISPVIRMSEMFLIYAETLFEEGDTAEAVRILNLLRQGRGKMNTFTAQDRESFFDELYKEYRREFLAEGQTVFAHKRANRSINLGSQIIPLDDWFTFPVPDGEHVL